MSDRPETLGKTRTQGHRLALVLLVLGLALFVLVAQPAIANNAYIVNLKNGSTIISKYKPVETAFDSNLMLLMTAAGNQIALAKDDIESIVSDLENRGFGTVINTSTIIVGATANDQAEYSEEAMMQDLQAYSAINSILSITSGFDSGGAFAGGGSTIPAAPPGTIPVNYVTSPILPVGPVSAGSSPLGEN